jgi:hypothetical protein
MSSKYPYPYPLPAEEFTGAAGGRRQKRTSNKSNTGVSVSGLYRPEDNPIVSAADIKSRSLEDAVRAWSCCLVAFSDSSLQVCLTFKP